MVPLAVDWRDSLPRGANGKFARVRLRQELSVSLEGRESEQTEASHGNGDSSSE